jgi:thioredoxin reductase (NADPH)
MKPGKAFDVIIIGGGIAGMTAAIYTARANLSTVIIEKEVCGGLVNSTHVVENFPSYNSINGMELMEKTLEQIEMLGVEVESVAEIYRFEIAGKEKLVETEEAVYTSRAVILATGRVPVPLPIQTECEQIHYCSICDGTSYKNKDVLVVGGGNSGFDEALYLRSLGVRNITLIEMMDNFIASQTTQGKLLGLENVTALTSTSIKELVEEDRLKAVVLENHVIGSPETVNVDGIFVFIGQKPNTDLFVDVVDLDPAGYVKAGENMATNLEGVFSAGDVNQKAYRQITTAMADGTIAALSAEKYIRSLA